MTTNSSSGSEILRFNSFEALIDWMFEDAPRALNQTVISDQKDEHRRQLAHKIKRQRKHLAELQDAYNNLLGQNALLRERIANQRSTIEQLQTAKVPNE